MSEEIPMSVEHDMLIDETLVNYKINYSFQKIDDRDHTYKSEIHLEDTNLLTVEINKKGNFLVDTILTAPSSSFSIPVIASVLDQGQLGSCVANAFAYTISHKTNKNLASSRLYHYAISRITQFTPLNEDSGTDIRTACQCIAKMGVVTEASCPYVISNYKLLPSLSIFNSAKALSLFSYIFIKQDLTSIKTYLTTNSMPIIFGFSVFPSFMSSTVAKTGIVPMPLKTESTIGGHCVCIVGYDDTLQMFTCVNSWGTSWGLKGYFKMPYKYLLDPNLASDFCGLNFTFSAAKTPVVVNNKQTYVIKQIIYPKQKVQKIQKGPKLLFR